MLSKERRAMASFSSDFLHLLMGQDDLSNKVKVFNAGVLGKR